MSELPLFGTNVDKSKVPALHQKRIVNAFVNSFILKTATFLEEFTRQCDTKLLNFEVKLRQVDTQLRLIESKLENIPFMPTIKNTQSLIQEHQYLIEKQEIIIVSQENESEIKKDEVIAHTESVGQSIVEKTGVKAKDDYRYKKFFKMIQFGVPPAAIKMKLQSEGMDPNILDHPDEILSDGEIEAPVVDSDFNSDSD